MMSTLATTAVVAADRWDDGPPAFWPIFPVLWLLLVAGAITAAVVIGRRNRAAAGPRAGEARLAERFAAGDIEEDEYVARLAVLRRG